MRYFMNNHQKLYIILTLLLKLINTKIYRSQVVILKVENHITVNIMPDVNPTNKYNDLILL